MKTQDYMQNIKNVNTIQELEILKENFLSECEKRRKKIMVSKILESVKNFGDIKDLFESIAPSLLSKKEGKELINRYTKIIKENNSLKTIYAFHEGLKENKNSDAKKTYIVEALSISEPINTKEYQKGMVATFNVLCESFKLLDTDLLLEKTKSVINNINESILYLSTTKKDLKNLNEYIYHINNVCENITESKNDIIDTNLTLEEVVSKVKNVKDENLENIFNSNDKEKTFNESKQNCLEMISKQKKLVNDNEVFSKLNEMEEKLSKKEFTFDTFTKDMLYMNELQEILK